jgi:probable F420-dependent oxidoreductase
VQVKFGIRLPVAGPVASVDAIQTAAQQAEELGYDSVWVHDFIGWTKEMDRSHVSCGAIDLVTDESEPVMFETMTNLAFLAGITSRITIGSAILCTPYRNPVVQAKQLACIDALSKGRLVVGAGVGALKRIGRDFEVVGVPRENKYERTYEYVKLMREIWGEPHPSFHGEFVELPETEIYPKPVQQPLPIWFAGRGEKAWEIMTDLANGWIPTWVTAEGYRANVPKLRDALALRGRSDESFTIAKECYAAIAPTSEEARRFSRPTFETFTKGFTVKTYEEAIASALIGSPEEILEQIEDYREAGVEHIEMKFIYLSNAHLHEQVSLFAGSALAGRQ